MDRLNIPRLNEIDKLCSRLANAIGGTYHLSRKGIPYVTITVKGLKYKIYYYSYSRQWKIFYYLPHEVNQTIIEELSWNQVIKFFKELKNGSGRN
jgi:hypothetical protein